MSDFLKRIRSGAEKTAFEADRVRRIQTLQLKIRPLNQEAEKIYSQVGRVAFSLYQQGEIDQPDLKSVCDQLAGVFAQIAAIEQEIETIRVETFVGIAAANQYGHICPNGHGQIPPQDNFCQICGAKAINLPPPSGSTCPNCQALLQVGARFCANCGQAVPDPPQVNSALPTNTCTNCNASMLPDAIFCTECGQKVVPADPEPAPIADPDLETVIETQTQAEQTVVESEVIANGVPEEVTATPATGALEEGDMTLVEEQPSACPVCEAPLEPDAVFCSECGHHIG